MNKTIDMKTESNTFTKRIGQTNVVLENCITEGSIISPILANIYMNELDTFMSDYKQQFDRGDQRAYHAEYARRKTRWYGYRKTTEKNWEHYTEQEREERTTELARRFEAWSSLPSMEPMDGKYRRILYCRYADDFLIGVIGSKQDAEQIRMDVKAFLAEKLHLELSMEKTLITNATDKANFLGYEVTVSRRGKHFVRRKQGPFRPSEGIVKLYVPKEKWMKRLLENENMIIRTGSDGKEMWKPVARSSFVNRAPVEIIAGFNAEIRGLYNYYALASNVSVLNKYTRARTARRKAEREALIELAKTDEEAARKLAEMRKYQSEATLRSRQKMVADAEAGDPEAIARYEATLAKRRENYHKKKTEKEDIPA